ncbi:alpha/beta hydrolase [Pseudomonas sp.]|uniref:alpha/beta fold hydrolase n=1 Tax=Pseudomonas sp. TaxID=306 RepID=UPI002622A0F5|nr:alpha/beta hydrolase [Pseudomonas sp.]
MSMQTIQYTGYSDLTLVADIGGDKHNPPVILLHGGGQTRHSWRRLGRTLIDSGYQVINLDMRGHGDSAYSLEGDYSLDAFIEDLKAVVNTLDHPPVLIGASLGGAVSLLACGESLALCARALILVDVVPRMSLQGVDNIRQFMASTLIGFTTLEEAASAIAKYSPVRTKPASTEGLLKVLKLRADGRYYWHWDPAFLNDESRSVSAPFTHRMETAASAIGIPTLLIRGAESDVVTQDGAQSLLNLIPHAQLQDVSGAGHMVGGDKNDPFNQVILNFLATALPALGER